MDTSITADNLPRPAACEPHGCTVTPVFVNDLMAWRLTHSADGLNAELHMTDYVHVVVPGDARNRFDAWGESIHQPSPAP